MRPKHYEQCAHGSGALRWLSALLLLMSIQLILFSPAAAAGEDAAAADDMATGPIVPELAPQELGALIAQSRKMTGNKSHALAMHGKPAYSRSFRHFKYVNPKARKQGHLRSAAIGTFDSLNPFILKGNSASGLSFLFDTLMHQGEDEAFTGYGLLAHSIEIPDDRSWVRFYLRPEARFHDGQPLTSADVEFSFHLLRKQGAPFYRSYWADVSQVIAEDKHTIRFVFDSDDNRELPLIVGQLPVLPKHYWQEHDFNTTSVSQWPLGSGPYQVSAVDAGRSITYQLDPNYWGKDLPVNRGRYNFEHITYDYYRDSSVAFEAFKAGEYDWRLENTAKTWATGYDGPALSRGLIKKETIPHQSPQGMQAFVFNTRLDKFADRRVRQAIGLMFDFEWSNNNLFYGAYTRTQSFFSNSELASHGLPDKEELKILDPLRDQLPPEVFTQTWEAPKTDGTGNIRPQLRQALTLLNQAGWKMQGGKMINNQSGEQLSIDFLLYSPVFERIIQPFRRNLERIGVSSDIQVVDVSQYINRLNQFDFEMVVGNFSQSTSPGNEQRNFWSSEAAATPGSRNITGIQNPAIDQLIELVIEAPDRESLITRVRALDRVLLWNHYVIPQYHINSYRVAYWDKLRRPGKPPKYQLALDTWWLSQDDAERIEQQQKELQQK